MNSEPWRDPLQELWQRQPAPIVTERAEERRAEHTGRREIRFRDGVVRTFHAGLDLAAEAR